MELLATMFSPIGSSDWSLFAYFRTSVLLMPVYVLAFFISRRDSDAYAFGWMQPAWVALAGALVGFNLVFSRTAGAGIGDFVGLIVMIAFITLGLLIWFLRPKPYSRNIIFIAFLTLLLNVVVEIVVNHT